MPLLTIILLTLFFPLNALAESKIAFTSTRDGNYEIYVMNPDGTNQIRLTNNPAEESGPSWSPDGSKIGFSTDRDGNYEIYTMNSDGTNQTRLTNNSSNDGEARWSPDGSKLVFSSWRSGGADIWVMNSNGSNPVQLTNGAWAQNPVWSPDGSKIAYSATGAVRLMNADGTNQTSILNVGCCISPYLGSWSPDGTKLAIFSDLFDGNYEIYTINSDGTNRINISNNSASDMSPQWATSIPAELPRTGQTTCYDSAGAVIACAGTGQDGEIQAGVAWPDPRFTDNGDNTVTDNLSGLMWTQDGNTPGPAACSPTTTKTWQDALDYVACLNTNSYLGYTDWRLPNILEFRSLVNAGQSNAATWLDTQGFNNVQSDFYWSSTSSANYPNFAWSIYMWYGSMDRTFKTILFYVWPVRSGQVGQALPPDVRIDQAVSGDQRYPWADYNETTGEYLVLWQDKRNGASDDIYGVRLDQNGNRIGSDFPVSTAAGHQQRVLVKAGGGGYLALWHDLRNQATNGADIYGAWISGTGVVGPEMAICACAMDQWNAVAGYDPMTNTFLVVWLDARGSVNNQGSNPNDDFDLYGVVIPAGGSQSLTPFVVVSADNGQRGPQIGYDYGNGQYYLAWNDRRSGTDYDIYGARLTTSGVSLDGTGVLLSGATGNQFRPTVTDRRPADGIANHLIAWSDYRSGSQADVYGVYVDGSGTAVGSDFAICSDPADEANVVADVDWINTKNNMVSWIRQQDPAAYYNVVSGVVDQSSGVTCGGPVNPVADEQRANALTYATDGLNDYGFLEVSADRRNGTDYDIWGIKVWP